MILFVTNTLYPNPFTYVWQNENESAINVIQISPSSAYIPGHLD